MYLTLSYLGEALHDEHRGEVDVVDFTMRLLQGSPLGTEGAEFAAETAHGSQELVISILEVDAALKRVFEVTLEVVAIGGHGHGALQQALCERLAGLAVQLVGLHEAAEPHLGGGGVVLGSFVVSRECRENLGRLVVTGQGIEDGKTTSLGDGTGQGNRGGTIEKFAFLSQVPETTTASLCV